MLSRCKRERLEIFSWQYEYTSKYAPVIHSRNGENHVCSFPSWKKQQQHAEYSMHRTNMTTDVVEITHIVYSVKSLTVPCSSRLTLILFSAGRCCLLVVSSVRERLVGRLLAFPLGCSFFELDCERLVNFSSCSLHESTSVSWERDWVIACWRFGPLLLLQTCISGWVSCTVLKFSPCGQFFMCILIGVAMLWRRLRQTKPFIHHHTKKNIWKGSSNLPRIDTHVR